MITAANHHCHRLFAVFLSAFVLCLQAGPSTGRGFLSFTHFDKFEIQTFPADSIGRLTSPLLEAGFEFDQIVLSWNIELAPGAHLWVHAQPVFDERTGGFYTLGRWSGQDLHAPNRRGPISRSGGKQSDGDGEVQTDVLVLSRPARKCRVRLTIIHPPNRDPTVLKHLGVSLLNSSKPPVEITAASESRRELILPVPTRSQLDYPGGGAWCSPTSVSMVLSYWSTQLGRPDLDRDVPEIAAVVYDPGWPGTGNWSFNTAYAGSFPGMRAYVTRLASVDELETWIRAGVPVVASITYSLLKGQPDQGDGHLVVVVGFEVNGDIILNDPGSRISMRKSVSRDRFAAAWSKSHNTVYLIHPSSHSIPVSTDGHW